MIALLSIGTLLILLVVNLMGLALAGRRLFGNYVLSKIATPVLFCLLLFTFEHYVGLGDLSWAGVPLTIVAAFLVYRNWRIVRDNWRTEALFTAGLLYAFAWRFAYPDLNGQSEKLTDLTFIVNYLSGSRLPPPDHWLPPFRYDIYYGFQYYSSALLGRLLRLDPGTTYHLSFSVISALTITAAGATAFLLSRRTWKTAVVVLALVLGSTGGELLVPLMSDKTLISDGVRFIGGYSIHEKMTTEFGKWLLAVGRIPPKDAVELPAETFGYLVYLGDHHPPMSGFLLLMLALLCIALFEFEPERRGPPAVLAGTLPVTLVSNSWNLPMQGLLVFAWILWCLFKRRSLPWRTMAIGFAIAIFLAHPFILGFGPRSLDYGTQLRLVPQGEHTPILLGIVLFAPYLLLLGAAFASAEKNSRALWWSALWIFLLVFCETIYVDDIYAGKFNRFNTTLKWWPWVMAGIVVSIGPLALSAAKRRHRVMSAAALLLMMAFVVPLARFGWTTARPHAGRISGTAWITEDVAEKPILEFLKQQPPSIVLQRMETDAFTPAPALVIHAGQTAFLGWPAHEKLWRGNRSDIDARSAQVRQFYRGEMSGSAQWLLENNIAFVLWLKTEAKMPEGAFDRIDEQIRRWYFWREYYRAGNFRVGFWSRRRVPLDPEPPAPVLQESAARETARLLD